MDGNTVEITIDGMSCAHCSGNVEKTLNALPGVQATVDLAKKTASVTLTPVNGAVVDNETLTNAINNAGYTVTGIKEV